MSGTGKYTKAIGKYTEADLDRVSLRNGVVLAKGLEVAGCISCRAATQKTCKQQAASW